MLLTRIRACIASVGGHVTHGLVAVMKSDKKCISSLDGELITCH